MRFSSRPEGKATTNIYLNSFRHSAMRRQKNMWTLVKALKILEEYPGDAPRFARIVLTRWYNVYSPVSSPSRHWRS